MGMSISAFSLAVFAGGALTAVIDGEGRFRIEAGTYRTTAERRGYLGGEYGRTAALARHLPPAHNQSESSCHAHCDCQAISSE